MNDNNNPSPIDPIEPTLGSAPLTGTTPAPAKAAQPAPVKRMRVDPEDGDALKALFDS